MTEPTGYTAVGMVGFTDKGTHSASASYVKNDLVHYGGSIWCCLIDDTTGITPTEGTNWTLFVGEPTNMAERIIAPLEVSPSENAYAVGEQLIFNDVLYKAKTAIAVGDALVVDTNIELAPKISSQIQTLTNETGDIVNVLGAKNLLRNNVISQVKNGVTFTKNSDGSVTLSGTATTWTPLYLNDSVSMGKGSYILSGLPTDVPSGTYLTLQSQTSGTTIAATSISELEKEFTITEDIVTRTYIGINSGVTVNVTVYPMLRPASIVDDTYVPYAMTNQELTESISDLMGNYVVSSVKSKAYPLDASKTYAQFLYGIESDFTSTVMVPERANGNRVLPLSIKFLNTVFSPDLEVVANYNILRCEDETTGAQPYITYGMRIYENVNYCYLSKKTFSASGVTYADLSNETCNSALAVSYLILTPIK